MGVRYYNLVLFLRKRGQSLNQGKTVLKNSPFKRSCIQEKPYFLLHAHPKKRIHTGPPLLDVQSSLQAVPFPGTPDEQTKAFSGLATVSGPLEKKGFFVDSSSTHSQDRSLRQSRCHIEQTTALAPAA